VHSAQSPDSFQLPERSWQFPDPPGLWPLSPVAAVLVCQIERLVVVKRMFACLLEEERDAPLGAFLFQRKSPFDVKCSASTSLPPPTITQSMPRRSKSTGSESGSSERPRNLPGTRRNWSTRWA